MTREVQKSSERQTLDVVMAALGLRPEEHEPEAGETPDFIVSLAGRLVGVEVTMYSSTDTVDWRSPPTPGGKRMGQAPSRRHKPSARRDPSCTTSTSA